MKEGIWCLVIITVGGVIMDGHPIVQSWWIIEGGQNRKSHILFSKYNTMLTVNTAKLVR